MGRVTYLFPPDQINALLSWRFVLHFIAPQPFDDAALKHAVNNLKQTDWAVVT
jgi:hypothetical protein